MPSQTPGPIPAHVLGAYVTKFPHLKRLAENAITGSPQATVHFARNACRLEAPPGVTPMEIYHLAGVAESLPWPAASKDAPVAA